MPALHTRVWVKAAPCSVQAPLAGFCRGGNDDIDAHEAPKNPACTRRRPRRVRGQVLANGGDVDQEPGAAARTPPDGACVDATLALSEGIRVNP